MGRFLRQKWARALLWYAADGACVNCGIPLPDVWHADHTVPWRVTHQTNVHDMQALCPACNCRKGGNPLMQYRTFQADLCRQVMGMVERIIPMDTLYIDVTPGGGKSSVPPALMPLLQAGLADRLCWVVPRVTLGTQGEEVFTDVHMRQLFPHQGTIRKTNGNEINPSRGTQGYLTTYHAIEKNPMLHQEEFKRCRYILILDECHHMVEGDAWARAMAPLIDRAVFRVFMSGTLGRGDKTRVAFLPYGYNDQGELGLQFPQEQLVSYSRAQALREKAIVRLDFRGVDGRAEWVDRQGTRQQRDSFEEEMVVEGAMLEVAIRTQFARELLQRATSEWLAYKRHYAEAKLLIVAPWQAVAKNYAKWLQEDFHIVAPLAISERLDEATAAIRRYKQLGPGALDVLITVGMAYEGLDVKQISHLVCLTRYRSAPWLEQCFARACRALPWKQAGFIYAPDDMAMRQAIEAIVAEQRLVEDEAIEVPGGHTRNNGTGAVLPADIVPLGSMVTTNRAFNYTDDMDSAETAFYDELAQKAGLAGIISPLQLRDLIVDHNKTPPEERRREVAPIPAMILPPSAIETPLRRDIQTHANWIDYTYFQGDHSATNRLIKQQFGKSREEMEEDELIQVKLFLNTRWSRDTPKD
jgi:superfamily II DNA or RNA helicase